MSSKKTAYILGPMTGMPDMNRRRFMVAAKNLRNLGYSVISPPELDNADGVTEWVAAMRRDIRELCGVEVAFALPGWQLSRGAALEACLCRALEIPVVPLTNQGVPEGRVLSQTELPIPLISNG
jgi:hypothetical protein